MSGTYNYKCALKCCVVWIKMFECNIGINEYPIAWCEMSNLILKNNLKIVYIIFKLKILKYKHNYLMPVLVFASVSVTKLWMYEYMAKPMENSQIQKTLLVWYLFDFMMLSVSSQNKWWIVKNLEVNSGDLIDVLYQHWLGRTGKNHSKPVKSIQCIVQGLNWAPIKWSL